MKRRVPVKSALMGLMVAPGAMAQDGSAQQAQATPPTENKPGDPSSAPAATMQTTTVTGTRPSGDFAPPAPSLERLGGDVKDIPQSITIINKALMESQGVTSLSSAVKNIPGVTLGAAEGGTIGNNININGFSARTDLYIDGMRDPAQYYRDTFNLEQIEILMGPSSMLFGRGSTGGLINQVMKKPTLEKKTEFTAAGTTNAYERFTADINVPTSETSAWRANMMFQNGSMSTRQQTDVRDFGFAPSYKFGIGTPTDVTLYGQIQYNHDKVDYGLPGLNRYPANVSPNLAYGFNDDRTDQMIAMAGATINHKFYDGLKLRNQTQANYVNTYAIETAPQSIGTINAMGVYTALPAGYPGGAAYNLVVRQQSHDRNITDVTLNNQTELTAEFKTGPVGHTLLSGIDLGLEGYTNQNYFRAGSCAGSNGSTALNTGTSGYVGCTPLTAPGGYGNPAGAVEQISNFASGSAQSAGFYMNDTVQLIPEVKFVGGLRYDIYASSAGNSLNSANTAGSTTAPYISQTDTFLSYRAGLLFQPTKAQTYYVSTSTSFNPSLEQLVSTTGTNSSIPPENNTAYEAGVKYDLFGEQLSLTGAVFQIQKNNARTANSDGTFSATGQITVKGVRTGVAGKITPEWQVFGGYTYLDARITNGTAVGTTGMIPVNTPTDSATLWSTYTIAQKYEFGGGVTYLGQRYANNTDSTVVPEFYRIDLTGAYKMEKADIRLNIFNLLNATTYDQAIASDGGRTVPGQGVTAMVSLVYRM